MKNPSWLTDSVAAIMLVTAVYCAGRLVVARLRSSRVEHDSDVAHLLMGVAMAGMLLPHLDPLGDTVWEAVFAAAALWFAARLFLGWRASDTARRVAGHHVLHLVLSVAMLYMYLAQPSGKGDSTAGSGMAGMSGMTDSGVRYPTAALGLALLLCAFAVVVIDRTPPLTVSGTVRSPGSGFIPGDGTTSGEGRDGSLDDEGARTGEHTVDSDAAVPAGAGADDQRDHHPLRDLLAPRSANCCHIAMSVTMTYLLIIML